MEHKIVYGSVVAQTIKNRLKEQVERLKQEEKRLPHLVVIQVGNHLASNAYVNGKEKDCKEVGFQSTKVSLPDTVSEEELLKEVEKQNCDKSVDGILVQLPLPKHICQDHILYAIDPKKDVDGFHPLNIGKMMIGEETFYPCTPSGCMEILNYLGYQDLSGKRAVVLGRSNIVGKPVAQLLLNQHATVTICHSKTNDVKAICKEADILIAAVGQAKMVDHTYIKQGAVVIDVGINRDEQGKLCGDVNLEDVIDLVSYITPVPKGVGLMTRAMLLENTWKAYKMHEREEELCQSNMNMI